MERTLPIVDGGRTRTLRTRHEVPHTCAVRQACAAWGRQQPALPLLMEQPGRTQDEGPRRWHGHSVLRPVEVEYSEGRVARETLRFVVLHSTGVHREPTARPPLPTHA